MHTGLSERFMAAKQQVCPARIANCRRSPHGPDAHPPQAIPGDRVKAAFVASDECDTSVDSVLEMWILLHTARYSAAQYEAAMQSAAVRSMGDLLRVADTAISRAAKGNILRGDALWVVATAAGILHAADDIGLWMQHIEARQAEDDGEAADCELLREWDMQEVRAEYVRDGGGFDRGAVRAALEALVAGSPGGGEAFVKAVRKVREL